MKVIIPVAGKGTRLRPHTNTKPKCLVHVAGKPILGHLLERLQGLPIEEIILIVDADQANEVRIRQFMHTATHVPVTYVRQLELKGPAHAIFLAREHIHGEVLIIFNDTLFDTDLSQVTRTTADALIWVKEVEDPSRFGLVVTDGSRITRLVEKPEIPPSNLAMIGMYYIQDGPALMARIEHIMQMGQTVKGEFYLPDPLQLMLDEGYRIEPAAVQGWYDCGTIEALLDTNRILLQNGVHPTITTHHAVIIPPVYIEEGACIREAVVGPYVSIAGEATIQHTILRDSIIGVGAVVEDALLQRCLIGDQAVVKGSYQRLNVGDFSAIQND